MSEGKTNFFIRFYEFLNSKYKAPEDCKLSMADENLNTMMIAQPPLLLIGIVGLILVLIQFSGNYIDAIPRIIYFSIYLVFGSLCIYLSLRLKKINFTRSNVKMIPTYILFTYLMTFPMYIYFYEHDLFNALVVYACVAVNFPVFFNIEPTIFCSVITCESVIFLNAIFNRYSSFIMIDSILFNFILYFLSLKRWGNEKDNYMHHRSEHEYKESVEKELQLANVVQQSFFKHNDTIYDDWAIAYYNKPMAGVSGDFLDIYGSENRLDGIGIFDVSGHGIASGLVTMLVKNIIFQEFYNGREDKLKSIIDRINIRYINEKGNIENYLTGILARCKGNDIEFINAGHAMPIFYNAKEDSAYFVEDEKNSAFGAIGLPDIPTNFISHTVKMSRGDELIFFTDGATEATNSKGEDFGKDRLLRSIFRNADRPLTTQINCVISDIFTFIGNEPRKDDITIIILKKK